MLSIKIALLQVRGIKKSYELYSPKVIKFQILLHTSKKVVCKCFWEKVFGTLVFWPPPSILLIVLAYVRSIEKNMHMHSTNIRKFPTEKKLCLQILFMALSDLSFFGKPVLSSNKNDSFSSDSYQQITDLMLYVKVESGVVWLKRTG